MAESSSEKKEQTKAQSKGVSAFRKFFVPGNLLAEKARLEAFLSAMPGDYCGFGNDGTIAFSKGFLDFLGLSSLGSFEDVAGAFEKMDSIALESRFNDLATQGREFSIKAHTRNTGKTLKISGTRGEALDATDGFSILWVEDKTLETSQFEKRLEEIESRADEAEFDVFRFRSALDAMPVLSWMRDGEGEIIWCNKTYAAAVESEKADVIAKQMELPLTKKSEKEPYPVRNLAKQALLEGEKKHDKLHVVISGKRLLLSVQESPLSEGSGTLGLAQDITREEELETEQSRYLSANKELLEQLQTAIGIFGADKSLEFYNEAFARLWGLEGSWLDKNPRLGEILDKLRETRQLPEQADFRGYKQEWYEMFTSLINPHEQMLYLPNGDVLRMLVIPHPMGGLMMTFEDVTSRLELESSYNTLVAVQKETLDNLSESVIVFGGDGRVKLWNPSFRSLWGLYNEDLDGEPHITQLINKQQKFFSDQRWPSIKDELIKLALERSERSGRIERDDDILLEYTTVPLPDGGILVTFFDVTDTVLVERALREKNQALQEAEKLKSDFLANVSYQLRTPLNSIMGFNDILTHEYFGPLNDKQKEYTAGVEEASEKLKDLIDNILDLASFEAGTLTLNQEEFDIAPMMEQIHEITSVWTRKEGIELTLKCPKNIGRMTADAQRLKQAMLNLIRNSIAFTPKDGKIALSVKRSKRDIIFTITDTGIGIKEEDIKRIFQPFERVDNKKLPDGETARGGVGLGLSLVRNIITLHCGEIDLASKPDKGTTIEIKIPIEQATCDQEI